MLVRAPRFMTIAAASAPEPNRAELSDRPFRMRHPAPAAPPHPPVRGSVSRSCREGRGPAKRHPRLSDSRLQGLQVPDRAGSPGICDNATMKLENLAQTEVPHLGEAAI